jgi:hypothetical protein
MDIHEQHPNAVKQFEALADTYRQDMIDDLTHEEGTVPSPPKFIQYTKQISGSYKFSQTIQFRMEITRFLTIFSTK